MFDIGDKVVYPMHGAGTIENIENRTVLGSIRQYYILRIAHGNMEVMVPVEGTEQAGLRYISEADAIDKVIDVLGQESTPMDDNWNRRNRDNMERLKSGDILEVAAVIRNLARVDRVKKLSAGEKRLLSNAKIILASEISFINGSDEKDIIDMIEQAI